MTEDAAVFGGHNNMYEGLKNAYNLYKPKVIAVCTSCMAEVIGDDIESLPTIVRKMVIFQKMCPLLQPIHHHLLVLTL